MVRIILNYLTFKLAKKARTTNALEKVVQAAEQKVLDEAAALLGGDGSGGGGGGGGGDGGGGGGGGGGGNSDGGGGGKKGSDEARPSGQTKRKLEGQDTPEEDAAEEAEEAGEMDKAEEEASGAGEMDEDEEEADGDEEEKGASDEDNAQKNEKAGMEFLEANVPKPFEPQAYGAAVASEQRYGKPYIVAYFRILHAYTIIYSIYIQRVFLFG